jgi:hypothetical protein
MARGKTLLFWAGGSIVVLGVLVVAALLWWAGSLAQSGRSTPEHASAAFTEVRERFVGVSPAFDIREGRLVMARTAASSTPSPTALHILVWMPSTSTLSRVRLPFALSRVATEPLPLEALASVAHQGLGAIMDARRRGNELNIRLGDLERNGTTLLFDGVTSDGTHVLMWSE